MAINIGSYATVQNAATTLNEALATYNKCLEDLETALTTSQTLWQGEDADAYRTKIRGLIAGEFASIANQIASQSKYLTMAAEKLSGAQKSFAANFR